MANAAMEDIINKFETFTHKPVNYLTVQNDLKDDLKNLVKTLYDYTKTQETSSKKEKKSALTELIVDNFDDEQVWQQLELQNTERWDQLVWEVANSISSKTNLVFPIDVRDAAESVESDNLRLNEENPLSEDEDMNSEDNNENDHEFNEAMADSIKSKEGKVYKPKSKTRPSIVDDKFFKLQDMEKFLVNEEKKEVKPKAPDSDEESINLFEDIDDEDSEKEDDNMMYSDFFDRQDEEDDVDDNEEYYEDLEENSQENNDVDDNLSKDKKKKDKGKKVTFANEMSDDDSDKSIESDINTNNDINANEKVKNNKDKKKTEFELRQERLNQQISRLEDKTLKEAPWQLKGEIVGLKRPQNSLLEEVLDVDITSRPPPVITEQTTLTLEDIIKQRIKDKAWDDVVKKQKAVDDQLMFRKPQTLDHSKSQQSLAQIYEAEYLKQKQTMSGEAVEEEEPENHKEIREAMKNLFSKLDALCHYHYTPKAVQAEVKIVGNTPAISMEEVAPVATSDAALLAPEEIKRKLKGDLTSKEERTKTDKNRERRKKKKLQKLKGKVNKVTDNKNTKKGVEAVDKSLKTSKAFFQQLNDNKSVIRVNKVKRNVTNKGQ